MIPFLGFPLYLVLGLGLYGLGKAQRQFELTRVYALPFELVGLLVAFAATYFLAFQEWWKEYSSFGFDGTGALDGISAEFWGLFGVAALVSALGLLAAGLFRYRRGLSWRGTLYEGLMMWRFW